MHDPDITYGFLLRSPETWAFKSLPCSMSLWWPWTLCFSPYSPGCDSDFRPHRARWWQEHETPAAVVRFSGGQYSLEQRAMSSPQSFLRPSHPRAPELEQRFQWSDTGLPRASRAWRLQPLSLRWNINAGPSLHGAAAVMDNCRQACALTGGTAGAAPHIHSSKEIGEIQKAVQTLAENYSIKGWVIFCLDIKC